MAPQNQQKRKRGDRNYSTDGVDRGRPSPHRPQDLSLAYSNGVNGRGGGGGAASGGGRRSSRGGGGGRGSFLQASPSPAGSLATTAVSIASPSPASKNTMLPPSSNQTPLRQSQAAPARTLVSHAPTVQWPAAGTAPLKDPTPYVYTFVTQERGDSWQDTGRQAVVDDVLARAEEAAYQELGIFFQEVLHLVTQGLVNPGDAGALVKELLEKSSRAEELDLPSLFLDTVAVCLGPQYMTGKEDTGKELGINQFLQATGVDHKLVCTLLDDKLLIALRIVRGTFDRMGIRYNTNVLYRQSGYNLLREESEGYSKLMTEFFTITHNFKPDKETVEKTWEKVKALIGSFDLDVGRVLDITLDAFANNLIKHNKFFIRLLRFSDFWPQSKAISGFDADAQGLSTLPPWASTNYPDLDMLSEDVERIASLRHGRDIIFWERVREVGIQAFFELGGRRVISRDEESSYLVELQDRDVEFDEDPKTKEKTKREEEADLWASRTRTFPPQGNSVAAQILGFKLHFYASQARDPSEKLSVNLIWLAALLIKIGFISLKDLYPHIYPTDDKMAELREKLEKEKADRLKKLRPGATSNALMSAGALSEGEPQHGLPANRSLQDARTGARTPLRNVETAATVASGPPPGQPAETVPELPEPEDQKIVLLRSLLLIGAIPDALYILARFPWLLDVHDDLPKYIYRLLHHMLSKVYAETQPLQRRPQDRESGTSRVELNNTSFLEKRMPPKSIAWGQLESKVWSESDYGISYRFYWDDWNDLVPICQNVEDVFTLCETFLNLVGHKIGRDAELLAKLVRIGINSLKEDASPTNTARWQNLSKRLLIPALSLTKADPGIVNEAWELIKHLPTEVRYNMYAELYGGQISRMPDIKTAFDLSRLHTKDVLKRISKTNVRDMARSLAKVSYPSPGIALHTGLQQIESYNNLIDTLIECIRYFTHIGFDVLPWQLLNALGGSSRDRMQADGMILSKWLQRLAEFTGKVCKRYYKEVDIKPILLYVKDKLKQGESTGLGVLGQMIVSMGGVQSDQNWSEEQVIALAGRPNLRAEILRRVGDKRHDVKKESAKLVQALTSTNLAGDLLILIARERQQYLERPSSSGAPIKVLSTNLTSLQFAFVQYLEFLRSNYSVDEFDEVVPPLDELIKTYRIEPAIAFTIQRASIQYQIDQSNEAVKIAKESGVNGDVDMKEASALKPLPAALVNGDRAPDTIVEDTPIGETSQPNTPAASALAFTDGIHPVLHSVIERLKGALEPGFADRLSMSFYVRFWQSNLGDLVAGQYNEELKTARAARSELNNDRSESTMKMSAKEKAAKRAHLNMLDIELTREWKEANGHRNKMEKLFKDERALWFPAETFGPAKHNDLANAIVQECILPRIVLSEMDALFTAKYIFMVHKMNTPGFRTAKILAKIFSEQQFIATLFMLTEREARNLGIFLKEVLSQLKVWRDQKGQYEKYGAGVNNDNPGFARGVNEDNTVDGKDPSLAPFDHANFQRLVYKWHNQMHIAILHCLSSKEFMHIRNAIFFVKQVHEFFPSVTFHGEKILAQVRVVAKEDERDDLKLSAASLVGDLARMKENKRWLLPAAFRPGEPPAGRSGTPKPGTPRPSLNAEASEFKPKVGTSAKEEEDGEIEDEKEGLKKSDAAMEARTETAASSQRLRHGETSQASTPAAATRPLPVTSRSEDRPSTPGAPASTSTSRYESNRTPSSHGPQAGMPTGLPARPQGPLPPHRDLHRRPDEQRTPSRQDGKADESSARPDRPVDPPRDAHEALRRRSRSPGHRSRHRSPELRLAALDGDRRESGPQTTLPRDSIDTRDPRAARPPRDSGEERHRSERETRHPGPIETASAAPHADPRDRFREPQGGANSSFRVNSISLIPAVGMNPERAALFAQDERKPGDERRYGRGGRRGQSPPRDDPTSRPTGSRGLSPYRGDRVGPERPPPRSGPRDRRDEPTSIPSGPSQDVPRGRNELFPGPSSLSSSSSSRNAPVEPNHGRLAHPELREPRSQQDPNYGRLNAPLAAPEAAPSGPRSRTGQPRGARTGPEPVSTPSGPRTMPPSPVVLPPSSPAHQPDRAPPSGPGGPNRRNGSLPTSASNVAPNGPPADVGTGIHPSRMQNIPLAPVQTSMPIAPGSNSSAGIPSGPRSGGHRSTPSQTNVAVPSPTSRYPPTGPASAGGSMRGRSTIGLINGVLQDQQAARNNTAAPGTSVRGRGSIGGQGSGPQQDSAPQSPTVGNTQSFLSQSQQMPPPGPPAGNRPDLLADRGDRFAGPANDDQRGGRRSSGGSLRDDDGGRRRRDRSRSPRRDAADNAMRQSGDMPPRNPSNSGPPREDGGRRRESGAEGGQHRERRSRGGEAGSHGRDRERSDRSSRENGVGGGRDSRAPSRNEGRPHPMGMPMSMPMPMQGQGFGLASGMGPQQQNMNPFGASSQAMQGGMNGDMRGGGRRDERERERERRDDHGGRGGHRDGSKRRRGDEGPPGGPGLHDQKRPRRGGQ